MGIKATRLAKPARRKPTDVAKHRSPSSATRPKRLDGFPIVGIGASAGGLGAFKKFFGALPDDSGAAFVLIMHLDPTRESLVAELVGTYTTMPVVKIENGMRVEASHVYVIPPNAYLAISDRTLRLSEPTQPRSHRMAIDHFLGSLADDQHANAIGIVLSGSGTDGAIGLKKIKDADGLTMVEDPKTAQHDGMPRSALPSADHVPAAEQLASVLLRQLGRTAGEWPEADTEFLTGIPTSRPTGSRERSQA